MTTLAFSPIHLLNYGRITGNYAQIDAAYAALADAGYQKTEVIVIETGWASHVDEKEAATTVNNARIFNYNLRKRLAKKKRTPFRAKNVLKAYILATFNENLKPGLTSERNFGLFKAYRTISYDIGFHGLRASSSDCIYLLRYVIHNSI
ncbi:glucan endo-1,3-beta-glucosidase 11-like [Benincasa hispida]|uniref:glucan endo-1,3-beta-glucosidase 11-like n=1 Tax=Benincasa hispida TaxID=102211 RepID=UPI001900EFFC|nr:glucan endo-1,3-beta-glucosidase 11-like [Benincasa hispida]